MPTCQCCRRRRRHRYKAHSRGSGCTKSSPDNPDGLHWHHSSCSPPTDHQSPPDRMTRQDTGQSHRRSELRLSASQRGRGVDDCTAKAMLTNMSIWNLWQVAAFFTCRVKEPMQYTKVLDLSVCLHLLQQRVRVCPLCPPWHTQTHTHTAVRLGLHLCNSTWLAAFPH